MQQAYLLLHPREHSKIQIQKIPVIPVSPLLRKVSPRCDPSTRQSTHLSASLENSASSSLEFHLVLLAGFPAAMSFSGSEDVIRLFADEKLAGTVEDKFIAASLDFATIIFFFRLFLHPLRHRFRATSQAEILSATSRAEMADVEQMKKFVPFVTCEIHLW